MVRRMHLKSYRGRGPTSMMTGASGVHRSQEIKYYIAVYVCRSHILLYCVFMCRGYQIYCGIKWTAVRVLTLRTDLSSRSVFAVVEIFVEKRKG